MSSAQFPTKLERIFAERVKSLREDGYRINVESYMPNLWFVKLRHASNGNRIILRCHPSDGLIEQERNHILCHTERI